MHKPVRTVPKVIHTPAVGKAINQFALVMEKLIVTLAQPNYGAE